jgi:hypothetical protein
MRLSVEHQSMQQSNLPGPGILIQSLSRISLIRLISAK